MRFTALSAEEIQESKLVVEGQYHGEVMEAEDTVSKAGNEMIKLVLRIYDQKDKAHFIKDYLMEAMQFKLLHFCESTNLSEQYKSGLLAASHCIGKKVVIDVIVETDDSGKYLPKNSIKDYVVVKDGVQPVGAKSSNDFQDDLDIPF